LNRCWRPTLTVVGIDGIPNVACAGNVLRPNTTVKLSIRLPPTKKGQEAADWVKKTLEENPPYGATVKFTLSDFGEGWNAPSTTSELKEIFADASKIFYNQSVGY